MNASSKTSAVVASVVGTMNTLSMTNKVDYLVGCIQSERFDREDEQYVRILLKNLIDTMSIDEHDSFASALGGRELTLAHAVQELNGTAYMAMIMAQTGAVDVERDDEVVKENARVNADRNAIESARPDDLRAAREEEQSQGDVRASTMEAEGVPLYESLVDIAKDKSKASVMEDAAVYCRKEVVSASVWAKARKQYPRQDLAALEVLEGAKGIFLHGYSYGVVVPNADGEVSFIARKAYTKLLDIEGNTLPLGISDMLDKVIKSGAALVKYFGISDTTKDAGFGYIKETDQLFLDIPRTIEVNQVDVTQPWNEFLFKPEFATMQMNRFNEEVAVYLTLVKEEANYVNHVVRLKVSDQEGVVKGAKLSRMLNELESTLENPEVIQAVKDGDYTRAMYFEENTSIKFVPSVFIPEETNSVDPEAPTVFYPINLSYAVGGAGCTSMESLTAALRSLV